MGSGQTINSIAEAPAGVLDMQAGGASNTAAFNPLQDEFLSQAALPQAARDRNSFMGGMLAETDDTVAEGLYETDNAIAKTIGGDKAMPVTPPSTSQETLISQVGDKQYLNIPNLYEQTPKTTYTANAIASADQILEPKKAAAALA